MLRGYVGQSLGPRLTGMEPSAPPPQSCALSRRRLLTWSVLALGLGAASVWLYPPASKEQPSESGGGARGEAAGGSAPAMAGMEKGAPGTTLSMRKKLELPLELNVQQGNLAPVMAWIEKQLDLNFLYQADVSVLESVTIRAKGKPLREILGDVFSRRNLAFVLQHDSIVVIPCKQSVVSSLRDGARVATFEADAEILCQLNEPVELYCGDRGQFRVRLLSRPAPDGAEQKRQIHVQLYEEGSLAASSVVLGANDQWAEAPFKNAQSLGLSVRPAIEDGIDLALGVRFRYTVPQSSPEPQAQAGPASG